MKTNSLKCNNMPIIIGTITEKPKDSAISAKKQGADMIEIRYDMLHGEKNNFRKSGLRKNSLGKNSLGKNGLRKNCLGKNGFEKSGEYSCFEITSITDIVKEAGLPIIGTIRSNKEGGKFSGNQKTLFNLIKFIIPHVDFVDIEIRMKNKYIRELNKCAKQNGVGIILSSHPKTPEKNRVLKKHINKAMKYEPYFIKIAPKFNSCSSGFAYFKSIGNIRKIMDDKKQLYCLVPVGKNAASLRKEMKKFNTSHMYGAITKKAAPGQLSVEELKIK
ncbi:MAG: type I 3-dehydroquinate dehydratase [Methanosarcinaceae archaeon]|nr:type I 3-dehydroquinate dehydratase [Methanosarcinaceae archaeon]